MSSDFSTGLMVSLVGLIITFFALLVFVGVILLLKVLFPYKEEKVASKEVVAADTGSDNDEDLAAAIAAVVYLRGHRSSQLGSSLSEGKSAFWSSD